MCMASAKDFREPADIQPMELTRARIPRFINSQAVGQEREKERLFHFNIAVVSKTYSYEQNKMNAL